MNERKFLRQKDFNLLSEENKLKDLVRLASFAPSSHNTQPWIFRIKGKTIELLPNMKRTLPYSDSQNRELYLSLGAAYKNMTNAAEAYGLTFESEFPVINKEAVGIISFKDLQSKKEDMKTLESLTQRHANRSNFEDKDIPDNFLDKISSFKKDGVTIHLTSDKETKSKISSVVKNATRDAFLDKGFTDELSVWIKPSLKKYRDGMPGYNIGIPLPLSFFMPFAIKYFNLSKMQVKMAEPLLKSTPTFITLATKGDSITNWLKTGEIFEKIFLEAEKNGIKIGIFGAPIEIGDNYKELQKILNTSERPKMFFRLGYSKEVPTFSPRLDIEDIIK